MTMKRLSFAVLVLILCLSVMPVFAAPYSVDGSDMGNDTSLLIITNPQYAAVTVPAGELVVSGYCRAGATVNVYKLSPYGVYEITDYGISVGASSLFFQKIPVTSGRNSFIIRAQMEDGRYQQTRIDAIYMGNSFINYIKNL